MTSSRPRTLILIVALISSRLSRYTAGLTIEEQRVICAKELVHVCDSNVLKVSNPDDVIELAATLCGKVSFREISQVATMKAANDILAQLQAQTLLFPKAARIVMRKKVLDRTLTEVEVAETVCMPPEIVKQMLEEDWEKVAAALDTI